MIVPDAADDEPPAVVFMMPVPNASNVSVAPTIIVGFSEPVQGVSEATFMLYGPGLIPAQVSYEPSIPGAALMPARTLLANTEHDVYLDSTITDAAGHPLTPVQWSFTTGADLDPPMVINSSPAPTETDVGTTAPVVVVFSEVVFNVSDATFTVDNAGTPIDGMVFMSTQDQAVFTPTSPYPAGATISVNLTAGIMDINGNALVPLSFSFTVAP
ncbi:MAG: Ig-like domain-containing protein [Kofleriaceae bacterium]